MGLHALRCHVCIGCPWWFFTSTGCAAEREIRGWIRRSGDGKGLCNSAGINAGVSLSGICNLEEVADCHIQVKLFLVLRGVAEITQRIWRVWMNCPKWSWGVRESQFVSVLLNFCLSLALADLFMWVSGPCLSYTESSWYYTLCMCCSLDNAVHSNSYSNNIWNTFMHNQNKYLHDFIIKLNIFVKTIFNSILWTT